MASIDKTFLKYQDYLILKDWCDKTELIYDNGIKGSPKDFLFSYTEPYEGEAPVWNTPESFDRWLYHNCPLSFIQERLKEQYHDPDLYFNEPVKHYFTGNHYTVIQKPKNHFRDKNGWFIEIADWDGDYWYGLDSKTWLPFNKLYPSETRSSCFHTKNLTKRKLNRLIKKWKLPIGTTLLISSQKYYYEYKIKIK